MVTACSESARHLTALPQLRHRPPACVASIWAHHVAHVGLGGKRNRCKYADVYTALYTMSNNVLCFMSCTSIHEPITG